VREHRRVVGIYHKLNFILCIKNFFKSENRQPDKTGITIVFSVCLSDSMPKIFENGQRNRQISDRYSCLNPMMFYYCPFSLGFSFSVILL